MAESYEEDRTEGRPGDPVGEILKVQQDLQRLGVDYPADASYGDLVNLRTEALLEIKNKEIEDKAKHGRKKKNKDGGYIKQYAHGGGVRKAKFMDD